MTETAADVGPPVDLAGEPERFALHFDDPREREVIAIQRCGVRRKERTPPQTLERRHVGLLTWCDLFD
jgi:hypothetical protein